jgi:hypothetical protein
LVACAAAWLAVAQTAVAQDSIGVTAAPSGQSVVVTASGSADSCTPSGCGAQTAEVEVSPYAPGNSCSGPGSPQGSTPISTGGGTFTFTTKIPVSGGQQYTVCGYVVNDSYGSSSTRATSSPLTVTVAPGPCPAGTPHALALAAPTEVADGRSASIVVRNNGSGQSVAGVSLTMSTMSDGTPFYTYPFTAGDVSIVNGASGESDFTAMLWRQNGAATVILTYQEAQSDISSTRCIDTLTATMTPVTGRLPAARLIAPVQDDGHGAGVAFAAPGGCNLTLPAPAVITVRGPGANWTTTSQDECSGSWRAHGRIPGISTSQRLSASGTTVEFHPAGHVTRSYALTVQVGRRVVSRGVLSTSYSHTAPQRIYDGTVRFISYCIDQRQTIHAYRGHLYCWLPGFSSQAVSLTRTP